MTDIVDPLAAEHAAVTAAEQALKAAQADLAAKEAALSHVTSMIGTSVAEHLNGIESVAQRIGNDVAAELRALGDKLKSLFHL